MGVSGPPSKKRPNFAQIWLKSANFGPKAVFFGLGWSVQDPPTLIWSYLTQKKKCRKVCLGGRNRYTFVPGCLQILTT